MIAFIEATDPKHASAAEALAGTVNEEVVIAAITYAEILVGPFRRGPAAVRTIDGLVGTRLRVVPITPEIARRSAELRASRESLRLADALVIATGDVLGAARILTADRSWRGISKRVEVI